MNIRISLVLHSHIPYVKRQGRWPFGEVWLFEAMAETYIPLLRTWKNLLEDGIIAPVTLSFSPTLLEQLNSKYIKEAFTEYLKERELKASEDRRFYESTGEKEKAQVASYYELFYKDIRRDYIYEFNKDLIGAVRELQEEGVFEVITTAATHAYLPLLDRSSLEHQVYWGKKAYIKHFKKEPQGFWLPECGYFEGIEDILINNKFKYFYVDSHAIEGGRPLEVFSHNEIEETYEAEEFEDTGLNTYRPYCIENKDIIVYGRNAMVSQQVWSDDYGYPGDEDYREFHKESPRSGIKYWKVTDLRKNIDKKQLYDPIKAQTKVDQHAKHFVENLQRTGKEAQNLGSHAPIIIGCYDTELFGHWWWEGISWLEKVVRLINETDNLSLVLPAQIPPPKRDASVFESSWGMGGKHFVWNNQETAWMWDILRKASDDYHELKGYLLEGEIPRRALKLALLELMLIQSSDWLFMVSNNSTRDYAMRRFYEHYTKFLRLCNTIQNQAYTEEFVRWLDKIEYEDDFMIDESFGGV